uniref:Histone deacetylase domain-containing protein n=1 Tax=Quercus lobata TaxID=97700 RepID=A0A7N2MRL1_QUELO
MECGAAFKGQDPMSRSSRCTFLQLKGRDTANTWEVDTPVKPPDVLFSIFLGSVTHDQILKVLASRNRLDPPVGFALIIPPGHCPIPKGPTGLCFRKCGHCSSLCPTFTWAKGVFIIDFDAHHGNGTNDAFYDDPDIFIISTHQDGSYPGTGKVDEVGHGDGDGTEIKFAYTWRVR